MGAFLIFIWVPTFYSQNYGVNVRASSFLSITPYVCAIISTVASGWIADALNNNKVLPLTRIRKIMQAIGSFGPAVCLYYLAQASKVC